MLIYIGTEGKLNNTFHGELLFGKKQKIVGSENRQRGKPLVRHIERESSIFVAQKKWGVSISLKDCDILHGMLLHATTIMLENVHHQNSAFE